MKRQENRKHLKSIKTRTYSKKHTHLLMQRSAKRRGARVQGFIRNANAKYVTPNFALTVVWHALETAGDRREGNILGMQRTKRQEHFMRKIRTLAQQLGFIPIYVWVRSVGARMGDHLHMALHWRVSDFIELVQLMEKILGSDVDHEFKTKGQFEARSFCRGWEVKEISDGLSGALRWGEYMAYQKSKHQDTSSERCMGFSRQATKS